MKKDQKFHCLVLQALQKLVNVVFSVIGGGGHDTKVYALVMGGVVIREDH